MAFLITKKDDKELPKPFFLLVLITTGILVLLSVLSICMPDQLIIVAGNAVSLWLLAAQYVILLGSLVAWVMLLAVGKKKRAAYGLRGANAKKSTCCIVGFILLYVLRTIFAYVITGEFSTFTEILARPTTWIAFASLAINFWLVFLAFFGEEYGWRYFLQPLMQRRFGKRWGVILLGIVWGLWHLPVDFFYYSPDAGLVAAVSQQITCITLGIFFAYAYMKTNNIWVPVILHFLNNNLIPVLSGNNSADVLKNQQMAWSDLPLALLLNGIVFGLFILSKEFSEKKILNESHDELPDQAETP